MLTVEDINVYYGAIHAIKGISLDVPDGEIVALIGSMVPVNLPHCAPFPG